MTHSALTSWRPSARSCWGLGNPRPSFGRPQRNWEVLQSPYPLAYSLVRRAEAVLATGGKRIMAARLLRFVWDP